MVVSRPPTESQLVERARNGDETAYEELVRAHQGIAFRIAYLVAGNSAEAEDAAQEGFVKAYRALGRFRRGAPFRPWLLQIVANEARNRRRSACRYFLELSEEETAATLGVRAGTVKSRTSRALAHLREELGEAYG